MKLFNDLMKTPLPKGSKPADLAREILAIIDAIHKARFELFHMYAVPFLRGCVVASNELLNALLALMKGNSTNKGVVKGAGLGGGTEERDWMEFSSEFFRFETYAYWWGGIRHQFVMLESKLFPGDSRFQFALDSYWGKNGWQPLADALPDGAESLENGQAGPVSAGF